MKVPRVRVRVWGMMAAVAVLALLFGAATEVRRRGEAFRRKAVEADIEWSAHMSSQLKELVMVRHRRLSEQESRTREAHTRCQEYYVFLMNKYAFAADHPWLPVGPDPSPPTRPRGVPRSRHYRRYLEAGWNGYRAEIRRAGAVADRTSSGS